MIQERAKIEYYSPYLSLAHEFEASEQDHSLLGNQQDLADFLSHFGNTHAEHMHRLHQLVLCIEMKKPLLKHCQAPSF